MSVWDRLFARTAAADPIAPGPATPPASAASAASAPEGDRPRSASLPQAGRTVVEETIVSKVLHGWLQNRHQTLFPLAVNLRVLDAAQRATLAQLIAIVLLADRGHTAAAAGTREDLVRAWLARAGADIGTMDALSDALSSPPALSRVIDAVLAHDLAAYAYVGSLIALDPHDGAGAHLLNYLAVRLALPTTLTRSANRRYRGSSPSRYR